MRGTCGSSPISLSWRRLCGCTARTRKLIRTLRTYVRSPNRARVASLILALFVVLQRGAPKQLLKAEWEINFIKQFRALESPTVIGFKLECVNVTNPDSSL